MCKDLLRQTPMALPFIRLSMKACGSRAAAGFSKKVIDVSRRLRKSALSLQVYAGRGDTITLGIENRDLITVVTLVVKNKLISVIAMRTACHLDLPNRGAESQRWRDGDDGGGDHGCMSTLMAGIEMDAPQLS
jgi:hypothetical protein